jgi:hypothetical protein
VQENRDLIHVLPLHVGKVGVCYVVSARRIIRPVFYDDTFNAARYVNNILHPFFTDLEEEGRQYSVFQEDFAKLHMLWDFRSFWEELQRVKIGMFHRYTEYIWLGGSIFSICCSTYTL